MIKNKIRNVVMAASALLAVEASPAVCPIDGYNAVTYPVTSSPADEHLSIVGPDSTDDFFAFPLLQSGLPHLRGGFFLGAETGDPLLNVYTVSRTLANRDHRSLMECVWNAKKLPIAVAARYRYVDTYSDGFDDFWGKSAEVTGSTMSDERKGVGYESYVAAVYQRDHASLRGSLNTYSRWHATPFFFSPLLEKGFQSEALINKTVGKLEIATLLRFQQSDWYYDHTDCKRYRDFSAQPLYRYHFSENICGILAPSYSSAVKPNAGVTIGIDYADSSKSCEIRAGTLSNKKLTGSACTMFRFAEAFECSLSVAHDYRSKERNYSFLQMDTMVQYRPAGIGRLTAFSNVKWQNSSYVPLEINTWIAHVNRPLNERIDFRKDTVTINQRPSRDLATSFAGVNGRATHKLPGWSFNTNAALMAPFGRNTATSFIIGKTAEISAAYATPNALPIEVSLNVKYNDRPSLRYETVSRSGIVGDTLFTAPVNLSLYADCSIPFIFLPVRSLLSETCFVVHGGPVRLYGAPRSQLHPRGNKFGPEIYAGFTGTVR